MLIEIIKKGSYYTVPLFEEMGLKQERVVVEISNDVLQNLQAEKNGIRSTPEPAYSDEYLNEHWRELIMTSTSPDQDDDEVLKEQYGKYLHAKHSS